jgi:enoyl-CoA hydratase
MIKIEEQKNISILKMERGKGNALNLEFSMALLDALDVLEQNSTRALVITGKDSTFCAGVDLAAMAEGGAQYVHKYVPLMQRVFERFARFPKPVVAAVNGHAIAGGAIIMFAADQSILVNSSARVGLTEVVVGVKFPAWALELARFAVPAQHLSKVALTGRTFAPQESLAMGLVDELIEADNLLERAITVAVELAAIDQEVFASTKMALRENLFQAATKLASLTDAEVTAYWASAATIARVQEFAQRMQAKRS